MVAMTFTWRGGTIHVAWHDRLLLWPIVLLILRAIAASVGRAGDPSFPLGLFRFKATQRAVMILVGVMLPLVVVDKALRVMHIEVRVAPIVLKSRSNGVERYHHDLLRDPELLWKFEPGSTVFGRKINQLGFREREVNARKDNGARRVICLGDSVTAQGMPGYTQYLHEMLTNAPPDGARWEAFGMGVYGYASQQGLRLFELMGAGLQPDIVTVSFGRNDHNLAKEADRSRMAIRVSPVKEALYRVLGRRPVSRLFLCALERQHGWIGRPNATLVRVSPEEFRENMNLFVREIRKVGAIPVLVTAPRRTIPHSYVANGYARTEEEFQKQHDDYAQIVRDVAHETGAPLLDLQKLMAGKDCDGYFAADAVHFDFYEKEGQMKCGEADQPGLRRVAREMYGLIGSLCATSRIDSASGPVAAPTP